MIKRDVCQYVASLKYIPSFFPLFVDFNFKRILTAAKRINHFIELYAQ